MTIIKFKEKAIFPSNNGISIKRLFGSIEPKEFIKLLKEADNKVNPRIAKENKVTKSIIETLEENPRLFLLKNKGILIASTTCDDSLDRNRVGLTFTNLDNEGIMDGGHTTLAIATYILKNTINQVPKSWEECKEMLIENYDDILNNYKEDLFKFLISIEIISPDGDKGLSDYLEYISEICEGRNNNVQLKETSKGNHKGLYDVLKSNLGHYDISWKQGDGGQTKSEDIISLSCLPLIFLQNIGEIPSDVSSLNKISLYSQKGKCIQFFNDVVSHDEISLNNDETGKKEIASTPVESGLHLVNDILKFFDLLYLRFPELYHGALPGRFGRISSVEKTKTKLPFRTMSYLSDYQYSPGFFYPILSSITKLMQFDPLTKKVSWIINPNDIDLMELDFKSIAELIKTVNFDPVKVGKSTLCYNLSERMFEDYLNKHKKQVNQPNLLKSVA